MYALPSMENIQECIITEDVITGKGRPVLSYRPYKITAWVVYFRIDELYLVVRLSSVSGSHTVRKEEEMPSYEFICEKCNKKFSIQLSLADYEKKKYACPKCKSRRVKQQISMFQTKTSRKS